MYVVKSDCILRREADLDSTYMGEVADGHSFVVCEVRAIEHDMKMVWRVRIEDPVPGWLSYKPELIRPATEVSR